MKRPHLNFNCLILDKNGQIKWIHIHYSGCQDVPSNETQGRLTLFEPQILLNRDSDYSVIHLIGEPRLNNDHSICDLTLLRAPARVFRNLFYCTKKMWDETQCRQRDSYSLWALISGMWGLPWRALVCNGTGAGFTDAWKTARAWALALRKRIFSQDTKAILYKIWLNLRDLLL